MRSEIWPSHPFRGPLLFVTPSGLQSCQLSLKHGGSSIKFKKTSILKLLPESLHLSRDKGSYTRDRRVHQSVVNERLNTALYINAYNTCLPARQQLLKLSLLLSIPAQSVSATGWQLPSSAQLSNAVLRLHAFLLTEIPSLILPSANKHYCETVWGFMQILRNVLGQQLSASMPYVTTTLSENCNYPYKGQKVEKDSTDSITGSTGLTNSLFFFPFLYLLSYLDVLLVLFYPYGFSWQVFLLPAPWSPLFVSPVVCNALFLHHN